MLTLAQGPAVGQSELPEGGASAAMPDPARSEIDHYWPWVSRAVSLNWLFGERCAGILKSWLRNP